MKTTLPGVIGGFGPITLDARASGRWAVKWGVEWEFSELADAIEQQVLLIEIQKATGDYRVTVSITPERKVGEPRSRARKPKP